MVSSSIEVWSNLTSSILYSISCHNIETIFPDAPSFRILWVINRWIDVRHNKIISAFFVSHPIKKGWRTIWQCFRRGANGDSLSFAFSDVRVFIFRIADSAASLIGPNLFRVSFERFRRSDWISSTVPDSGLLSIWLVVLLRDFHFVIIYNNRQIIKLIKNRTWRHSLRMSHVKSCRPNHPTRNPLIEPIDYFL